MALVCRRSLTLVGYYHSVLISTGSLVSTFNCNYDLNNLICLGRGTVHCKLTKKGAHSHQQYFPYAIPGRAYKKTGPRKLSHILQHPCFSPPQLEQAPPNRRRIPSFTWDFMVQNDFSHISRPCQSRHARRPHVQNPTKQIHVSYTLSVSSISRKTRIDIIMS